MRHRIFVPALSGSIEVTGDEFHHATRVVRVRDGEEVEVFDGKGHAARGRVARIDSGVLRVEVIEAIASRESPLRVHLAPAIIALDKFELVLQKATELGVAAITPLVTDRIEIRAERYRGKAERWQKIVFEAVKQSGRAVVPALHEPATFDELTKKPGTKFVFDGDEQPDSAPERVEELTLLIGPEGGWSEREIRVARETGCVFQRLGPRRLRAETASLVAVTIASYRYADVW